MSLDCFKPVPNVNIHQLYLELVVADDLECSQDPEIYYFDAVEKLKGIKDELDQCPKGKEEILDFYCQDAVFHSIVGDFDRYDNLCRYLEANKDDDISTEAILDTTAYAVGMLLSTLGEVEGKMLHGMEQTAEKIQAQQEIAIYDTRCRYALPKDKIMTACKQLKEAVAYLEKSLQNPKSFNVSHAMSLASKLGVPIDKPSTLEKIGAGSKAVLLGTLKTLLPMIGYGILAFLITIATFGLGYIPAVIWANVVVGSKHVTNITKTYKNSLNKKANLTMGYMGWTPETFKAFAKEFLEISRRFSALKTISDVKEKTGDPNSVLQLTGFVKLTLAGVKGLGKVLVAMADAANIDH